MTDRTVEKTLFDNDMPAGMGKVLGTIGPKTWLDFMIMVAGIWSVIIIILEWVQGFAVANGWKIGFFILAIWAYVNTTLFIKLGPFYASKFKKISGAFSFLREEDDAKNFLVIIGAWTAVLDTLMSAITGTPPATSNWVILMYIGPLFVFGLFLLKGPLFALINRIKGLRGTKVEKKPKEKVVKTEPKSAPAPTPKAASVPTTPAPAATEEKKTPKPVPTPAIKPTKKQVKKPNRKPGY